jgi:type III secretion system low calcium response chaperone LcrH/SycD
MAGSDKAMSKQEMESLEKIKSLSGLDKSFAEVLGIKDEDLEAVYAVAHNHYQQAKFDTALQIFQFLTMTKSDNLKYWKGLASTYQMLKQYNEAIVAYSFCAYLDFTDPEVPYHAGQCYLALGDLKHAEIAFNGASFMAGNDKKHAEIKKHADLFIKTIHEKVKAHG